MKTGSDTAGGMSRRPAGSPEPGPTGTVKRSPITDGGAPDGGSVSPKPDQNGSEGNTKKKRPLAVRILVWILLKSIVPILCVLALLAGLYLGYVKLGQGPEQDVWEWSTWKHMYDLIFAE